MNLSGGGGARDLQQINETQEDESEFNDIDMSFTDFGAKI